MEYRPGEQIPGTQYRFKGVLGEGGHGMVYAVEHTFLQAPAVMKLLHADLVDQHEIAQRMTAEARTLAKLRHPNIVEVTDGGLTGESPKRPYFVMEALNGMSLRDMRRHVQKGIGYLPALRILVGLLEGLEHAHRNGVIHRDIKPDNIFLHRTSTDLTIPKILDFGIAHLLTGRGHTGKLFIGTPRYAAPEQLKGEQPTPATDIYAAGLVLWELVTGEPPFVEVNDITALMVAHMTRPMPSLREKMSDAPPALEKLLALMLDKDPLKRPQSAFHAAVALREARAVIEREQSSGIETPDFLTEPTPMDNMLIGASPADAPVVAATRAPDQIDLPPTEVGMQPPSNPFANIPVSNNGQSTQLMPNRPSSPPVASLPFQNTEYGPTPASGPQPAIPNIAVQNTEYGAPPKPLVDRSAETRAQAVESPSMRMPKSDTQPIPPKPSFTTSHGLALSSQDAPVSAEMTRKRPSLGRIMFISAIVGAIVVSIPFVIIKVMSSKNAVAQEQPKPVVEPPPSAIEPPKPTTEPVTIPTAPAVQMSAPEPPASVKPVHGKTPKTPVTKPSAIPANPQPANPQPPPPNTAAPTHEQIGF